MKTRYPVASALILPVAFGTATVHAEPLLNLTLTDPDQIVAQGTTTVSFDATISNPSTTDTIYLNGDAATTSSPFLTVDDSPFFANAPLSLAPGQSTGPFELLDLDLAADTPVGVYTLNTFSIQGGADGGAFSDFADLADAQFSVTVNPATASVPEPGTIALFGVGLAAFALARRKRCRHELKSFPR